MDGPFAEAKEYISYAVYDVRAKEEAVEWASRFMRLHLDTWPGWEGESRSSRSSAPRTSHRPPDARAADPPGIDPPRPVGEGRPCDRECGVHQ